MDTQQETKAPCIKELAEIHVLQQNKENGPHNPIQQIHQPCHQTTEKSSQYPVPTKDGTCIFHSTLPMLSNLVNSWRDNDQLPKQLKF